ncbi:S-layer homology domain-containing protein [Paenibacillus sp. LPE1-1-1.1]|uniref:S-layer homology domain-containing protein n=1 Tax=Paenibacillus sp. LPE1-1-1.1 TaxID=3135230 RepID=UPI003426CE79
MKTKSNTARRLLALLLSALLILPVVNVVNANPAEAAVLNGTDHFDYFSKVYEHLDDENHVFQTLNYEELVNLFDSKGSYVVLFGGAWSESTQANIGFINQVAKEYGVDTIYNFDTKLDGQNFEIADSSNPYAYKYVDVIHEYLTNLNEILPEADTVSYPAIDQDGADITKAVKKIDAPFLFVYDGTNKRIVDAVQTEQVWNDYLTNGNLDPAKAEAYKAEVRLVFDSITTEVNGIKTTNDDVIDYFEFFKTAYNKNANIESATPTNIEIFNDSDQSVVYKYVTYDELTNLLESDGNYTILFGGSWCPNTRAAIKFINQYAKKYNVGTVYLWDTKLDGGVDVAKEGNIPHKNETLQVRSNNHPYASLYVDIVTKYLTNIKTQNNAATPPSVISYTDANGNVIKGDRLQVPFFFQYNKNNKNADGTAAPILGHIELMYTWTSIQPDYVSSAGTGVHHRNYTNALDSLFSRVEAVPTGLTAVPPTTSAQLDGKIAGTTNKALEYKLVSVMEYKSVTGDAITNLAPGTYNVRYAAKAGYNGPTPNATGIPTAVLYKAGQSIEIVVPANTDPSGPITPAPAPTSSPSPAPTTPIGGDNDGTPPTATVPAIADSATGALAAKASATTISSLVEQVKKAEAAGKSSVVELKVEASAQTKSVELSIPRSAFNDAATSTNAGLKLNYGIATVVFGPEAVDNISKAAETGDISVIVSKVELTDEGKEVLGDRPVYDFSVFAGLSPITTFGGSPLQVSVPYTLKAGEDPHAVVVYYVAESGLETIRGYYNESKGTVDFTTSHFSQYIVGYNKVSFTDVADTAWYENAVGFLAARGITTGTDEEHYSPNASVTRGQFIVLLLKAYGITPIENESNNFKDAGDAYYTNYLGAAKRLGITNGIDGTTFDPNREITRQDLFTLLYRSLDVLGELPAATANVSVSSFSDAEQIADYASDAFKSLVEGGVIAGSESKLSPREVSTRAQVAQVLYHLLSK